jgi:hypothetical protein
VNNDTRANNDVGTNNDVGENNDAGENNDVADVLVQAQRPDLVILDRSVHGRHRIALVELTCPWDTDARNLRPRDMQTSRRN